MEKLTSALMKPDAYDDHVENVRLVQTHISWIFLTGKHVYKIKKPVNFGFLDFTTLEKRKVYCEKELEINKRLAKDMYLEVVPINQHNDKIKIKGEGKTIEYAVKMKELPQNSMMLKLLEENKVNNDLINRIAEIISDFHSKQKPISQPDSFEIVKFNWDENFKQIEPFADRTISKKNFDFIKDKINKFLLSNRNLFEKRNAEGKIKDCHGDLHSGNIFIADKIYIFDAIEFNERFRIIDVANEVAFLAMDLDFHDRANLSDCFVDKYVEYTRDRELWELLDFYKCYRAFVRGKVMSFKADDKNVSEGGKQESEKLAKEYFNLALIYAQKLNPIIVIMCGLMGTGKSVLAKKIASKLKAKILKTDVIRKMLAGVQPAIRRLESYKHGIYSKEFTDKTYNALINEARETLKSGNSCILDATFSKKKYRKQVAGLAKYLDLPFFIIECVCPENIIKERLERRVRGKSVSDGRWELFHDQKKEFEQICSDEENHIVVDTSGIIDEKEILISMEKKLQ